jgi:hypothetical protein
MEPEKHKLFMEKYTKYISKFKNKQWKLRYELVNYCNQDVKTLHQIY